MGPALRSAEVWRGRLNGNGMREQVERTGGGTHFAGGDPQVSGRGRQAAVAEQQLDGPDIRAGFQQMNRESVAQRMGSNRLADAREPPSLLAGQFDGTSVDRLAGHIALGTASPSAARPAK